MQLQLRWPSCTLNALPARAGHSELMEIPLLCRDAPGRRNINPPLDPRRGIGWKHDHLHTEPQVTELPRNKEQRYKTMSGSATHSTSGNK